MQSFSVRFFLCVCVLVQLCSTLFTTMQCHTHSNRIYCVSSSQPKKSELDFIFNGIGEGVSWVGADGNRVKCQEFLCFWNCRTLGRLFVHKSQHTIFIPFVAHIHHREISFALFSLSLTLSLSLREWLLSRMRKLERTERKIRRQKLFSSFLSSFTRFTSGSRRRYQQTVRTQNIPNSLVAVNKTFLYTFVCRMDGVLVNVHRSRCVSECVCVTKIESNANKHEPKKSYRRRSK